MFQDSTGDVTPCSPANATRQAVCGTTALGKERDQHPYHVTFLEASPLPLFQPPERYLLQ
ncbi:hypothetical protein J2741_001536 [Methanolinea mesophila]|nr:hypothetical protein [Methanolinea mesophila]